MVCSAGLADGEQHRGHRDSKDRIHPDSYHQPPTDLGAQATPDPIEHRDTEEARPGGSHSNPVPTPGQGAVVGIDGLSAARAALR